MTSRARGLRDTLVIARRELLERVRSKWFVGVTLLAPLGMLALILIPALLASGVDGAKVDIVDRSGVFAKPLHDALAAVKWQPEIVSPDTTDEVEMARIRERKITGFVKIPSDVLDGGEVLYRGTNGSSMAAVETLRQLIRLIAQEERANRANIPADIRKKLFAPTSFESRQTDGKSAGSSGIATYWLGYILGYITMLVILVYAVSVMRSVVQEKTTRVMELMVATVKPRSLMIGKIAGVGSAGLLQIAVWLTMGALTLAYRDELLGLFGRPPGGSALPSLAFVEVVISLAYFVLGYFFYASMYASVGAMVSSEQDTQQVQMPITILLMIGFACIPMLGNDPHGTGATVLTMLPMWSSLLMPMRYLLGGAGLVDVAISLAILIGSTVVVAGAAAKIYRVGVLMYGKRPSFKELVRWLRY